jgi:hypothetical protein
MKRKGFEVLTPVEKIRLDEGPPPMDEEMEMEMEMGLRSGSPR